MRFGQHALVAEFATADAGLVEVLRQERRQIEHDEIGNAVLEPGRRHAVRAVLPVEADIAAHRALGMQVGIAEERKIEIVERRRMKGAARRRAKPQALVHAVPVAKRPRRVAAKLAVVVVAHVGLHAMETVIAHESREGRADRARGFRIVGVARDLLPQVLRAGHERSSRDAERVLPRRLILVGAELRGKEAGRHDVVSPPADAQSALPERRQLIPAIDLEGAELLAIDVVGREAVVEVRLAVAEKAGDADLVIGAEAIGELDTRVGVAIRIAVGIVLVERNRRPRRIELRGVEITGRERNIEIVHAAPEARAHRLRIIGAVAGGQGIGRRGARAFGEDLDHAADRVRAVDAGQWTGDDFDALDLVERNVLERRRAGRGRADPHAVDQHQRVRAVRAAHEYRARLPAAAVARDLDAAKPLQQRGQRLRPAFGDILSGDHGGRLQRTRQPLRQARRRHDGLRAEVLRHIGSMRGAGAREGGRHPGASFHCGDTVCSHIVAALRDTGYLSVRPVYGLASRQCL